MIGMKKRIEIIERLAGKPGRLLVVAADNAEDADFRIVVENVERRLTDKVLIIPCEEADHPHVRVYEPGLKHLLARLDGNSKPLIKDAA